MKVVFLDVDGVLNSGAYFHARSEGSLLYVVDKVPLDPVACARVHRLCETSGASIVVSSTWRMNHRLPALREMFAAHGLKQPVIGVTPRGGGNRGLQIQDWLTGTLVFREVTGMVILDDDQDMAHLAPWLVKTAFATGILDEDVDLALEVLNRAMPPVEP